MEMHRILKRWWICSQLTNVLHTNKVVRSQGRPFLQAQLREKQKQLKGLTGELNMEQAAAEEHKDSVMRLQQELHGMRHLWLEAKKQVGWEPLSCLQLCCQQHPGLAPLCA